MSSCPTTCISSIVRAVKALVRKQAGINPFQASFYDHVIRNKAELSVVREYILTNPVRWAEDRYYV